MQKVLETPDFVVFDDVLDEESWSLLWTHINFTELAPVTRTEGAWKHSDGMPLAGPEFHSPTRGDRRTPENATYPTGTAVDALLEALLEDPDSLTPWVSDQWIRVSGRPYVYPPGSALSWHADDHEFYSGAFVYYCHPEWNVDWGGELMVASGADPELPMMPFRFDNREYSDLLMATGAGHFILPKPNRLVLLGDVPHMVKPVAPAAGAAVRASLAGFFIREDPES